MAVADATPVASLPMYDWPEIAWANDVLWAAIAGPPDAAWNSRRLPALEPVRAHPMRFGAIPALVLSQTCGYPFATRLRGMVRLVGTPIYDCPRLRRPVLFEHHRRTHRRAGESACGAGRTALCIQQQRQSLRICGFPSDGSERRGSIPGLSSGSKPAVTALPCAPWRRRRRTSRRSIPSAGPLRIATSRRRSSRLRVHRHDAAPARPALHHRGGAAGERDQDDPVRNRGCHRRPLRRAKRRRRLA